MKNIIFIAAPAAGKGTQSSILMEQYGYIHISTGDMLREEISNNTSLGVKANEIMAKGGLVDDEIIIGMVENKLNSVKGKPFILDGFPINEENFEAWDKNIREKLDAIFYLEITEDEMKKRLMRRNEREDDNENAIKERIRAFNYEMKPLINYFESLALSKTQKTIIFIKNRLNIAYFVLY